jgi:hypothetical protein
MFASRMAALVIAMAAVGSAGALWAKPPTTSGTKADRAAITTAVQHGSFAAAAHVRTSVR